MITSQEPLLVLYRIFLERSFFQNIKKKNTVIFVISKKSNNSVHFLDLTFLSCFQF